MLLTIFAKNSIMDVRLGSKYACTSFYPTYIEMGQFNMAVNKLQVLSHFD